MEEQESLYAHDPLFERLHSPLTHPGEMLEELGVAGPSEGLDQATSEAYDPDSPTRWQQVEYDDDYDAEDDDAEEKTWSVYTCHDLDKHGHWDVHDCCSDGCHDGTATPPPPISLPHPKGGNVLVRGCCALHEFLHNHLVKGHEDFLADLFGGDD